MNTIINQFLTSFVWWPKKLPSVFTSPNQKYIIDNVNVSPKLNNNAPLLKPCIDNTAPIAEKNNVQLIKKGQGDWSTKWYEWDWNLFLLFIICKFVVINYNFTE